MNINLNLYKYFYEVAKEESYTKAANNLYVSQPSLSYSVKTLEEQLGYKLFNKENNKIALTEKGEELYNKLKPFFETIFDSDNEKEEKKKTKLGVRSSMANVLIPRYIYEFTKINKELEIDYVIGYSKQLLQMVRNGEVDFILDEYKYDDLTCLELKDTEECCFFASINNDIDHIDENNINKYTIHMTKTNKFNEVLLKKVPNIKVEDEVKTPLMIVKIENGNDIGFTVKSLIEEELLFGKLKIIKNNFNLPKIPIYAISRKDYRLDKNDFAMFMTGNLK